MRLDILVVAQKNVFQFRFRENDFVDVDLGQLPQQRVDVAESSYS